MLLAGITPDAFRAFKSVMAYYEDANAGQSISFALCPSGYFRLDFWLLSCKSPLSSTSGADVFIARCTCAAPERTQPCCPQSPFGSQKTLKDWILVGMP